MRAVEGDEGAERPRRDGRRRRREVGAQIGFEFGEEDGAFRGAESAIGFEAFDLDDRRAARFERGDRAREERVDIGRAAGRVAQNAETLTRKRTVACRGDVIVEMRIRAERRDIGRIAPRKTGEECRDIGHAATHRTRRILRMRDRHDVRARNEPDGGLEADEAIHRRWARHGPIGLRTDTDGREARRDRRSRARRRSARIAIEGVGIFYQSTDGRPAADRMRRANVRPFRKIRLSEHDRACGPQTRHERCIAMRYVVRKRERARGRCGTVVRLDIIFHEHRDAREHATQLAGAACGIARAGVVERVRVERDHAMERRAARVDRGDSREICAHERFRGDTPAREIGFERRDRFFGNGIITAARSRRARRAVVRREQKKRAR